jgi:hypothetical protein
LIVKGSSSNAQATTTPKRPAKAAAPEVAKDEEVAIGQEVVERLKSWCYV